MSLNDSIASDQLQAYFERLERMSEERKAIGDDIAAIYAEAKGMGFDTKVMKIVLKKRQMDHTERMEQEALVELYMAALGMVAIPADYDAEDFGTLVATRAPAHDLPDHDADTGEILESHPVPVSSPGAEALPHLQGAPTGEAAPSASPVDIQPETANETHERPSTNDEPSPEAGPQAQASPAGTGTGTLAGREGRHEGEAVSADLPTQSLTGSAADKSGSSGISPALPAPTKLKMNSEFFHEPHPACQRPGFCGGNSQFALCDECRAAAGPVVHVEEPRVLN